MILYTSVTLLTIGLAVTVRRAGVSNQYQITRQQLMNKICLAAIFTVLFLLGALRVGVGNDYNNYIQNAHELYVGGYTITEPGYNLVVKALYALVGGEKYTTIFALFAFVTTFLFIKAIYEQSDSFAISFFLFMTLAVYFRSFNTVRYYFALAVSLYSMKYLIRKQYVRFIILIIVAALFHKSVLIVIPLYIVANRPWKRWFVLMLCVMSAGLFVAKDYVMELALSLYPTYRDTIYLSLGVGVKENIPAILRCLLVLGLCAMTYKKTIKDRADNTLYFNLNIMAILLYTACSFLPLVSRFGYYLITSQILLIANIFCELKKENFKHITKLAVTIVVIGVLYFGYFLSIAKNEGTAVLPYHTWIMTEHECENEEENIIYTSRFVRRQNTTENDTE